MNARSVLHGAVAGLAGGLVFGAMMIETYPMIGRMVGQPSAIVGFFVHLVNSAVIGSAFAILLGRRVMGAGSGLRWGLLYGGVWWFLGPLTLMPLFLGMGLGVNWNLGAAVAMIGGLFGHLLFGAFLGAVYAWLRGRTSSVPTVGAAGATAQN